MKRSRFTTEQIIAILESIVPARRGSHIRRIATCAPYCGMIGASRHSRADSTTSADPTQFIKYSSRASTHHCDQRVVDRLPNSDSTTSAPTGKCATTCPPHPTT